MHRFIRQALIAVSTFLLLAGTSLSLSPAQASAFAPGPIVAATNSKEDACKGLNQLGGGGCGSGQSTISNIAKAVVTVISYIAGVVAIIMIIVSGIRFITSNGDSNKVSTAKTALFYALIGLAVAGLAQVLTRLVLSSAAGA